MKVTFTEHLGDREISLIPYNSISRIPFSISIGNQTTKPETITCRNLSLPNFVEFSFNLDTRMLYSISCINIAPENIVKEKKDIPSQTILKDFDCSLEKNCDFEISEPILIIERPSSIQLFWNHNKKTHYYLNNSIALGVDEFNNLSEIVLLELDKNSIKDILGN